ncbi:MAG: hypothetical protein ACLQJ0_16090 [Steroidobacteraceae bacterium]|jgi:hypothetical protein
MTFEFPLVGDHIEVCLSGYHGRRYRAERVFEHEGRTYVVIFDPCPIPDCTEHDDYTTVSVSAVRPFVSG